MASNFQRLLSLMKRRQSTRLKLRVIMQSLIVITCTLFFSYSSIFATAELSFIGYSALTICHQGDVKEVPISIINIGNETGIATLVVVENHPFIDVIVVPVSVIIVESTSQTVVATVTVSPFCPGGRYIVDIILIELELEIDTFELEISVLDSTIHPALFFFPLIFSLPWLCLAATFWPKKKT